MIVVQKNIYVFARFLAISVLFAGLANVIAPPQSAYAACYGQRDHSIEINGNEYDASLDDFERGFVDDGNQLIRIPDDQNCYKQNYDSMSPEAKEWAGSYQDYMQSVKDCEDTDGSVQAPACANAIVSCTGYAINWREQCGNTSEKGLVDQIAENCHEAGYYGQVDDDNRCNVIGKANDDELTSIEEELIGNFNCNQANLDEAQACREIYQQAIISCAQQYGIDTTGSGRAHVNQDTNNEYGHTNLGDLTPQQYESCIYDRTRENVNNEPLCTSLGGIWIDSNTPDPGDPNGNVVERGCYNQQSDLINPAACEQGGGTWTDNTPNNPNDNDWGCRPPPEAGPCDGRGGVDPNDSTKCLDGSEVENAGGPSQTDSPLVPNTRCGKARVNLLACGTDEGNLAFQNLLKIAAIVLSFAVGAAAVAGLAWASVLYAKAEDNEGNVAASKELIRNIVIGLLLYVLLLALVNWLVPGGLFGP